MELIRNVACEEEKKQKLDLELKEKEELTSFKCQENYMLRGEQRPHCTTECCGNEAMAAVHEEIGAGMRN